MKRLVLGLILLSLAGVAAPASARADQVRLKDLGRFMGADEIALVGYGIVIGLDGTGDSPHNEVTQQAIRNVLSRFGANVTVDQVRSRNVAAVMVTATYPQNGNPGDRFDVNVSSLGDARSLLGGSLLMTPLLGASRRSYAVAQGPVVVGGYRFEADRNIEQKNDPTSGVISGGGVVQVGAPPDAITMRSRVLFVLKTPDITTAERIADGVNAAVPGVDARVRDAKVIELSTASLGADPYRLLSRIENVTIAPDAPARVVVNERSGTVVAGGGVQISSVVISQGDIKVSVKVDNEASQPGFVGGYAPGVRSLVVSNTRVAVSEPRDAVVRFPNTTVADLVTGLSRVHVHTREMIAILQAMQAAGALHADIIVQ